ncbi:MAG: hypothetical protein IPH51_14910 [Rubrivivax sp.]|nr:hypothetical protein [Rubrivivax sp.]
MTILYGDFCGMDKQINQIIFAGAHDAGISAGRHNVKTQHVGIRLQANAGVRLFDVRVTDTPVGMATYHGNAKLDPTEKHKRGAYGETLEAILNEARDFVSNEGASEFLILKFDKCKNYRAIAVACMYLLGRDHHFRGAGSLNTKTLDDVKGKVITIFTSDGLTEARGLGSTEGIFGCRSLKPDEKHDADYAGLQYFGKGGTNVLYVYSQNMKIRENRQKQKELMRAGMNTTDREVMGMMYWTSTGILESIKERNDKMWNKAASSSSSLQSTWQKLMLESIEQRTGRINPTEYSAGGMLKVFMPNIVMIDFASDSKGQTIRAFNTMAATSLVEAFQQDARRTRLNVI